MTTCRRPALPTLLLCLLLAGCGGPAAPGPSARTPSSAKDATDAQDALRDWPQYRGGPMQQGVAADALPPPLKLAWEHDAGAAVKGGAAIAGGRVYLGTELGEVLCLDLKTGERLWTFETDGPIEATPLVIDGAVYIGSSDFFFYKLDAKTGDEVWKVKTDNKILGSANHHGTGGDLRIYVGSYDHHLYQFDPEAGEVINTFKTENYVHGTPAVDGDILAFGGCDGNIYILDVSKTDSLTLRHKLDGGAYMGASVCLADGRGTIGTYGKEVLCFDLASGKVAWRFTASNFPFFSSAAFDAKRRRYCLGGRDKKLHALDAANGEQAWEHAVRGRVDSSPVLAGDFIYMGSDDGRLYALDAETGEEAWSYDLGGRVSAEPAIAQGMLVIGSAGGKVFAFQPAGETN